MHILEKKYIYQINDLSFHFKKLEKEEKITQRNQKEKNKDNGKKSIILRIKKQKGKSVKPKAISSKKLKHR